MLHFMKMIGLLALLISISSCAPDKSQKAEFDIRHPELKRNCPYLLSAKITGENNDQVLIRPTENESYNSSFGDECKGDFKRVLDDLNYFADYFDEFGSKIIIDFGEIFYAHDTKSGFVRRTRRDLSRALNGFRGINHYLQKEKQIGRLDELGTEPFDSEVMVPIGNRVMRERFYRDYEYFLNRLLNPFDLRVLSFELSTDTTLCQSYKRERCTNDFPFPNRWGGLQRETYALGGVRGKWRLTEVEHFTPQYRNCPVIIKHRESSKGLHLWVDRHEGFNSEEQNECEGNLQTVWKDIELFEPLMKKHAPNIIGKFHIGFHLKYFPDTQLEISQYLSSEIGKRPEVFDKNYDRNQLDDVLKLRGKYLFLIREKLPDYVSMTYTPILNVYLIPYGIQMNAYNLGEKTSFCIAKWENCITYFPRNDELMKHHPELDVLFLGTWDYGWKTKKITP